MFTRVPIIMRLSNGAEKPLEALINVDQIQTVFPFNDGLASSVMLVSGDKVTVNLPFAAFSERLLELREACLETPA